MNTIESLIVKIEGFLACALIVIMVCLSFTEVMLRNFFQSGIPWADIFLRQLVLWFAIIGASMAASQGKHIKLDILPRILPAKINNIAQLFVYVFAAAVSSVLAWASWQFVASEKDFAATLYADIPTWIFQIVLPAGFALIAVKFLFRLIESISFLKDRRS
ncbi:TRAP transporter small permease [Elusimicrobiota bacterium]